ncbi:hypothetical protein B9Z51_02000 [Limnohabitans sp. T6-5]|uniref:alkaline phosphatase family protein n=1 Tax=Limnohabitans sp. T6-5 TaxID=1100724 RepID=UPI000D3D0FD6|nr:alkaline phosphatase family protein [Limnohabitans sp. T6-5]PUE11118.1 hypothetical protein B9Z51_02000 [Limnohabitans sp. T6-5]
MKLHSSPHILAMVAALVVSGQAFAQTPNSPIKHLIVVVGENTSFDTLFAAYQPPAGQTVKNLLSSQVITLNGEPGPEYQKATQKLAHTQGKYDVEYPKTSPLKNLPRPYARADHGAPKVLDEKIPGQLQAGPFQITKYRGYAEFTDSNPVHRFFQMWQQVNGGRHDLFVWAGLTSGEGALDKRNLGKGTIHQGEPMGFYNMASGDVPYFRELASTYALADNYHQAVMGGTMPNYLFLASGDIAVYQQDGAPQKPPSGQIENPDPMFLTDNWYKNSGYKTGSYVACADESQPGVESIRRYLKKQPYKPFNDGNCAPGSYYLVNNYSQPYTFKGDKKTPTEDQAVATPQSAPNIGTQLEAAGVSWKWYHGGRLGKGLKKGEYASDTDPLTFFTSIMESPLKQKLQGDDDFFADVDKNLPSISFISPPVTQTGHPHYGSPANFEAYVKRVVEKVQSNPKVWANAAILVTYDEGGGYYDSGYIQPIDFFGDGTRIPLMVVSPWAKKGHVEHTYYDHASIHKFIQKNWSLKPLSNRTRDNLPNPIHSKDNYVPDNRPAIGDLFDMFTFTR